MKKFEGMLLGCDMDGTLLDSAKHISSKNESALRYFAEEGGLFSLATGRSPGAIKPFLAQIPFNSSYSLLNGSLILNKHHEITYCAGMPQRTKELICSVLLNFSQLGCEVFLDNNILICRMSEVTERHMNGLHLKYDMVDARDLPDTYNWCKINFTGDPQETAKLKEFLRPYADDFCVASSTASFCEITEINVNKGTALQAIAKESGIDQNHIFAVGDSFNDESMLRTAHISFAPKNADDGILKIADIHVSCNDNDALADVVEYLESVK